MLLIMRKLNLPFRFGLIISGVLIAYFLLLSIFDLHSSPIFSLFNTVIVAFGIFEAIKTEKSRAGVDFNYALGFSTGIITGFIATLVFTGFFIFYATELSASFLENLLSFSNGNLEIGIGLVTFIVAIMGFATTVVLTLTFMQLFKRSYSIA
jgi:hypothetical protein